LEWWMIHLFSQESPRFGTEFFVIHPLTSLVYPGKAQPLHTPPPAHLSEASYTLLHSTVLSPHSPNLRDTASPQKVVTCSLWEVISPPLPPGAGPNLNPGSY
jgi:hypothetical protein